jgi:thioredoxin 1
MLKLNEANFAEETKTGLVLVDFYAEWCVPCKVVTPLLSQLKNVKVVKVDIEENMNLSVQFKVSSIPCLVFLKDGVEVERMIGIQSLDRLQQKVDELNA